jgi:hypothetical protein
MFQYKFRIFKTEEKSLQKRNVVSIFDVDEVKSRFSDVKRDAVFRPQRHMCEGKMRTRRLPVGIHRGKTSTVNRVSNVTLLLCCHMRLPH